MAIATGNITTYQDMVDMVINTIKDQCENIGSVTAQVRNGLEYSVSSTVTNKGYSGGRHNGQNFTNTVTQIPVSATFRINDSLLNAVPESTVISQFNGFMISRGIASKANTVMTMRGIINFIANASAFIRARVIRVGARHLNNVVSTYYDSSENVSYSPVTDETSGGDIYDYMELNTSEMLQALNNVQSYHSAVYNTAVVCCSSSSSSCSSSCSSSSSSSSSSSVFIAYMRI